MAQLRQYQSAIASASGHALHYLGKVNTDPVPARATLDELRRRFGSPLPEMATEPGQVIDDLVDAVDGGLIGTAGGRSFAWVIGGALPASLAADWLVSTWDQNAVLYACSPAAAVVEEVAGEWLKSLLGLPQHASFAFVTGCQAAHTTCLAAARHHLLQARGWDVEKHGLAGAPPLRVLDNGARHASIDRALRLLGLGTNSVESIGFAGGPLEARAVAAALARSEAPTVLLTQAGDIHTGGSDPFSELLMIARKHGAWTHVDGAFGLWANASDRHRHLLEGVELADSWAADGHKWLNVPFDSGYAFVAHPESHRAAMDLDASYIEHHAEARDALSWTPEWSRRARGFATFAAIRQLGRSGIEAMIDRSCDLTSALVEGIARCPRAQILSPPLMNQALIRFLDVAPGAGESQHDVFTQRVVDEIEADGSAFFQTSVWRGRRVMRVSVCNWRTTPGDVSETVDAVTRAVERACE